MDIFNSGYTNTDLVAHVGTATQSTIVSISPVLEVVGGILLAFMLITTLIAIFREIGTQPRNEKGEALYEDDLGHIHHGIIGE